MKNISIIILLCFLSISGYGQFTNTTSSGSATTLLNSKGGYLPDSALILSKQIFADTTAANLSVVSKYSGTLIQVAGNQVWFRTLNPNKWNQFNTSAASLVSIAQGYGIVNSPNPITTTGSITTDTVLIIPYTDTLKINGIATKTFVNSGLILKLNISDTTLMLSKYINTFSNQTNISGTKQFNNAMTVADNITAVAFIKSGATGTNLLKDDGTSYPISSIGTGSVTNVSVTTSNGVSGSVLSPTTTPAITLTLGAITPASVSSGVITGTGIVSTGQITATGLNATITTPTQPNITLVGTLSALTVTNSITAANLYGSGKALTGVITSTNAGTGITVATNGGVITITNSSPSSGGTVTAFSSTASSGIIDVVTNSTTTPTQVLSLGNITPTSLLTSGAISTSGTVTGGTLSGTLNNQLTFGYGLSGGNYNNSQPISEKIDTTLIIPYTDTLKANGIATKSNINSLVTGVSSVTTLSQNRILATPTTGAVTLDLATNVILLGTLSTTGIGSFGGLTVSGAITAAALTTSGNIGTAIINASGNIIAGGFIQSRATGASNSYLFKGTNSAGSIVLTELGQGLNGDGYMALNTVTGVNNILFNAAGNSFINTAFPLTIGASSPSGSGALLQVVGAIDAASLTVSGLIKTSGITATGSITAPSHITSGGTSAQVVLGDGTLGTYGGTNYWSRSNTTLTTATANDIVSLSTTSSGLSALAASSSSGDGIHGTSASSNGVFGGSTTGTAIQGTSLGAQPSLIITGGTGHIADFYQSTTIVAAIANNGTVTTTGNIQGNTITSTGSLSVGGSGTITGNLTVTGSITAANFPGLLGNYLPLTGGTLTGQVNGTSLAMSGAITSASLSVSGNISGAGLTLTSGASVSGNTTIQASALIGGAVLSITNSGANGQSLVVQSATAAVTSVIRNYGLGSALTLQNNNSGTPSEVLTLSQSSTSNNNIFSASQNGIVTTSILAGGGISTTGAVNSAGLTVSSGATIGGNLTVTGSLGFSGTSGQYVTGTGAFATYAAGGVTSVTSVSNNRTLVTPTTGAVTLDLAANPILSGTLSVTGTIQGSSFSSTAASGTSLLWNLDIFNGLYIAPKQQVSGSGFKIPMLSTIAGGVSQVVWGGNITYDVDNDKLNATNITASNIIQSAGLTISGNIDANTLSVSGTATFRNIGISPGSLGGLSINNASSSNNSLQWGYANIATGFLDASGRIRATGISLTGNEDITTGLTVGTNIVATGNIQGASITSTGGFSGTLTTAAQPNITSLGTQASALNMGSNNITNGGTASFTTGTFSGTVYSSSVVGSKAAGSNSINVGLQLINTGGTAGSQFQLNSGETVMNLWGLQSSSWGNVGSFSLTTGVYTPLSDKNKKKDFEPSTTGLDAIMKLKPTLYRIKTEDANATKHLGFLAQEVKDAIPQAYVQNGDFIGVDFNAITAAIVLATQKLKQTIDDQQKKIYSQNAELEKIKAILLKNKIQ